MLKKLLPKGAVEAAILPITAKHRVNELIFEGIL